MVFGIGVVRLALFGTQAQKRAHRPALPHRLQPVQGQNIGRRNHRSHSRHGAQNMDLRVALRHLLDRSIQPADLLRLG
jgi:hypothetical protein